jgi:hypothetical protein
MARGGSGTEPGAGTEGKLVVIDDDDDDEEEEEASSEAESVADDDAKEEEETDAEAAADASVSANMGTLADDDELDEPTDERSLVSSAMKAEYSLSNRLFSFSSVVPSSLRQSRVKCVDSPQISQTTLAGAQAAPVRFGHCQMSSECQEQT